MHILKTTYEFPPLGGGGAKVANGVARRLAARGHVVDVITMGFRGLPRQETIDGVSLHRVPGIRMRVSTCSFVEMIPYILFAPIRGVRQIRTRPYVINHTHFIFPDGVISYVLKKLTGLPYVITAHGSDVPGYNPNRFKLLHRLLLPIWRVVVKDASLILCPSMTIENLIKVSSPQAKTRVIPNAIETSKFEPREKMPDRLLVVTRMFERKGVQFVVRALADLKGKFEVNIVGDGPYLPEVKALAASLGVQAKFWGHVDNESQQLKDLYETSAVFVFTSEAENFPIVLLEAMTAGAAIVTSSGTGCAEVVGDSGILVPVRDAAAIRDALARLANDPALVKQLGQAARQRVLAEFGWDRVIDQHLAVYAEFGRSTAANKAS